jgi:AraC-like DNA-binding protein
MHGAMGVAVVSAPTLRDGLDAVAKFARTRDPFMDFRLIENPDEMGLEFVTDVLPLGDLELPMIEICMSFAFALLSVMGGSHVTGARIALTYPNSANAGLYAQYLPVPFEFGAARNALMLPRDLATTRSITADPALHQNATAACTRELAAQKVYNEAERVRWLLDASLMLLEANQNGIPLTFKQMARSLGRSERALSRELAAKGTSFRQIRDESIANLSCRLLKTTHLPLAAIAAQTGFDDVANFSRAFKRMTGMAPGMFRRADR